MLLLPLLVKRTCVLWSAEFQMFPTISASGVPVLNHSLLWPWVNQKRDQPGVPDLIRWSTKGPWNDFLMTERPEKNEIYRWHHLAGPELSH
jgi:hypothetical protein